jgi:hypothetical protein
MRKPITPEHRAAMNAGRVRAAEARKLAARSTEGMAAGHERDEQRRVNKDANEERIEKRDDALDLEGIDESKLKHRDNETLARLEQIDAEDVQNKQPGYRYARITCPEGYGYNAKANIRQMKALAEKNGYEPVQGEMLEDKRFKGNDHANGGTLRGLADTFLWRIREEDYQAMMERGAEKARREGAIEDQTVRYAESRGVHTFDGQAGQFRSGSLMAQVARDAGRVETFMPMNRVQTKVTEGDLRRGSMRGPDGQIMKPGFERTNLAGR